MARRFTNTHPHEASSRHNRRANAHLKSSYPRYTMVVGIVIIVMMGVLIPGLAVFDQPIPQAAPELPCEVITILVMPDLMIGECQPQADGSLTWTVEVFMDPNIPPATQIDSAVCPIYDPIS